MSLLTYLLTLVLAVGRFSLCSTLCMAPNSASADDNADNANKEATMRLTVIAGSTAVASQDSLLRQDQYYHVPERINDISALLESEWAGVVWRVRGQQLTQSGNDSANSAAHGKLTLTQAYKKFTSSDQSTTLSIGKRNYALDQTFIGQPLAFLQKSTDLGDPNDSQGKMEGIPMVALSWAGSQSSVVAIYSDDTHSVRDGYNSGIRQKIVKFGYEFSQASLALLLRQATGESTGLGATASATVSDAVTLYGSYYRGKGTLMPILGPLSGAQIEPTAIPLWRSYRIDNGVAYPRFTLGATITPPNWPQIQVEYISDTRGLNDAQFSHLMQMIDTNEGANTHDLALALRRAMIATGLPSSGLRQHYGALNIVHSDESLSAAVGVYQCLDDASRLWYGSLNKRWNKHWSTAASMSHAQGKTNSERGLALVGTVWSLHGQRSF